jgi:uncharacterized protein (DUF305 family)
MKHVFSLARGIPLGIAFAAITSMAPLFSGAHDVATPMPHEPADTDRSAEASFLQENDAAMTKMMESMAIKPTGNVDRDFVAMMVPHHQGGIDMAMAVLRHGHNEQLRRLAQEIIVTQQQEIAAMHLAIGESLPPSKSSPTQPSVH